MSSVEIQLHELARHLDAEFPDVGLDEIGRPSPAKMIPYRLAPLRSRLPSWAIAVVAATVVFVVIGGLAVAFRVFGVNEQQPVSPAPQTPMEFELGITDETGWPYEVGETLPTFTGDLLGGGTFNLGDLRGAPVLIMLWAEWCPPCIDELDHFQNISNQWAGQVEFVSVLTAGSTPELASSIVAEHGFTVPVVIDETDALWGPLAIPNFVLLDADGKVIAGISGSQAGEPWDLNTMLQRSLP